MAAYAAVISLKHTINNAFLNSSSSASSSSITLSSISASMTPSKLGKLAVISLTRTINDLLLCCSPIKLPIPSYPLEWLLELAYGLSTFLQLALEKLNDSSSRKMVDKLDGEIRDVAHRLEDVLEFFELNSQEDEEVRKEILSFIEVGEKMEKEYIEELSKPLTQEEEEEEYDDAAVMNVDFGVDMVGHSTLFNTIRNQLLKKMRPIDSYSYSMLGECGSGITASAKAVFEEVGELYECCAWVTLGTTHEQVKEVVIRILEQVDSNSYKQLLESGELEDEEMMCKEYLYKALENRRYMIVLGDVRCSLDVFQRLRTSFPDHPSNEGSLLLFTTNKQDIASSADSFEPFSYDSIEVYMQIWLPIIIFFSPELKEAGRKIIHNCRGLLIPFLKTCLFLYKRENTVEEWRKIASNKEHPVFMVEDEISEMAEIKREMQSYNRGIGRRGRRDNVVGMISTLHHGMNNHLKRETHPERFFPRLQILCLVGMSGIGKTTFAKKIIQDELIFSRFDHCVWVTLGPKYRAEEILLDILGQIYRNKNEMRMKEDEEFVRELCLQLSSKRCLIVLDDLWSKDPLRHLKNQFRDIKGTILVTTTLADVAEFGRDDTKYEMELLDEEESWCLLRKKVFGGEDCPFELEKAGRKIAENCEGLPLLILTVADQLLKEGNMSKEYWEKVASGKEKSIFKNAHDQISKALRPRFQILPQHLKICFLYIGVFRQKYKIPASDFTNMLIAEGILETNSHQTMEEYVAKCVSGLVQRSLAMVQLKAGSVSEFKTCRLHAVFWHLANSQAMKNKFFHAMNCYDDCSIERMKRQRRLCIRNSILLGFKDVQDSMASVTSAHSLLCVSPLQQYPVPIDFDMRLLRVMNAITIRLYEFPAQVVRLLCLRYLALTFNGKLPTSISSLWKLEYLIVKRHVNIKSTESYWLLPMEIWDMKELKNLQFMGGRLPNPNPQCGAGLPKLTTLLDVSIQSCTKEVLEMIPNLKRLGIRIELAPNDNELLGDSFLCLNNVSRLGGLESFKCEVVNPQIGAGVVPPLIMFPSSLKRLSLSGMGYPWEYMNCIIGGLRNLEVLKLKHYAFQGPKWEMDPNIISSTLISLSIEDTNLVVWKLEVPISWALKHLCLKHCYKLKELPTTAKFGFVENIEIVECSPFTVTWAEQIGARVGGGGIVKVHPLGAAHNHQE